MLLGLSLAACNHGAGDKVAVRQGVIDYVAGRGLNVSGMNVEVTAVQFNGSHASATVSFTPKGGPGGGMSMQYELEQKNGKWAVTGRKDASGSPHGAGAMPGGAPAANPHGGGAGAAPGGAAMPSPEDLPPIEKKK